MSDELLPRRIYVELPTGGYLTPGQSPNCPGPDANGTCPALHPGGVRPCAGGVWFVPGDFGWRAELVAEGSLCPMAVLDPLGPASTPLD